MQENSENDLPELDLESNFGGLGVEDNSREIPIIDLNDFDNRFVEIADELWQAATTNGFFELSDHDISIETIEQAFELSKSYFSLSDEIKSTMPLIGGTNAGWESKSQVRPSTKTADQKESYQITRPRMQYLWPKNSLPHFKDQILKFEKLSWKVAMQVLSCFAYKLNFERDFFSKAHDPSVKEYQSTLRLLHYFTNDNAVHNNSQVWRAGAHTDFDCLTLLFQKTGQHGLQVCPGNKADSNAWTNVPPKTGLITCNIGDMLMRWSDDKLKSTLHRVRMPKANEYQGERYSIAYFAQANQTVVVQGPEKKYEPITASEYLKQRIAANFSY